MFTAPELDSQMRCVVFCTTAALPRAAAAGKLQGGSFVDLASQPLLHSKPEV